MPTIKDKLNFNYNGIWSDAFKVKNVVLDNGMFDGTFVATRTIVETNIRGNDKPLFSRFENEPLEFEMTIAFEDTFTDELLEQVIHWIFTDGYKPLYFQGKEDKIYYCTPVDSSNIVHTGYSQGYFTINMRCDSPYMYSPVIITDQQTITTSTTISIVNDSDITIHPEISIITNAAGHIVIESLDDTGDIFEIRNLSIGEDIYINTEKEIIQTDIPGVYRYGNIIGDFPRILEGSNRFKITGNCTIQFRYRFKYRF